MVGSMGDTSLQWRYLRPSGAKVMQGVLAAFSVRSESLFPHQHYRWSWSIRCDLLLLQVKCIEFHPMQPWLGIADEDGNISVWDLHTQQLVYESKLATPDEVTFEDAMLQRAAEKEPDYFGPQLSHVRTHHQQMLTGCQCTGGYCCACGRACFARCDRTCRAAGS